LLQAAGRNSPLGPVAKPARPSRTHNFFLAGMVAAASFSGAGIDATVATSAMDAGAVAIAESNKRSRSKFHDMEEDAAADVSSVLTHSDV